MRNEMRFIVERIEKPTPYCVIWDCKTGVPTHFFSDWVRAERYAAMLNELED